MAFANNQYQVSAIRCKYFWKRGVPVLVAIFVILIGLFLCLGNNQWCRWSYIFQAYIFPGYEDGYIRPSDANYSGEWKTWYFNGALHSKYTIKNGKFQGPYLIWRNDGSLKYFT